MSGRVLQAPPCLAVNTPLRGISASFYHRVHRSRFGKRRYHGPGRRAKALRVRYSGSGDIGSWHRAGVAATVSVAPGGGGRAPLGKGRGGHLEFPGTTLAIVRDGYPACRRFDVGVKGRYAPVWRLFLRRYGDECTMAVHAAEPSLHFLPVRAESGSNRGELERLSRHLEKEKVGRNVSANLSFFLRQRHVPRGDPVQGWGPCR